MVTARYICGTCNKEFVNERGLAIHQASHARTRLTCPKCGKKVMYLDTHIRKAHAEDTQKLLESLTEALSELEHLRAENTVLREELAERSHRVDR